MNGFVLKGNICYSLGPQKLRTINNGYLVCVDGVSMGAFEKLPSEYRSLPLKDCGNRMIIPGLTDLHVHAPQYPFCGMGMDLELLDWLDKQAFPEEEKYAHITYAKKAYKKFVSDLTKSVTTRACIFATIHKASTLLLMEMLEKSGLVSYVGKVSMNRNCPDKLREQHPEKCLDDWLEGALRFNNTKPIITPRFIPSCTDGLLDCLSQVRDRLDLPVQSHISENQSEIELVKELCPDAESYADAYDMHGLLGKSKGGKNYKAVMAHCVYPEKSEIKKIAENGVFIAHCPASNTNLTSGIAPIRKLMEKGVRIGLGSDAAAGHTISILSAAVDAVQMSKMYCRLIDKRRAPLTFSETFYLATVGGGEFFGKVGSFENGYEFDAVILDDSFDPCSDDTPLVQRLERFAYLSLDSMGIAAKFVRGKKIYSKANVKLL